VKYIDEYRKREQAQLLLEKIREGSHKKVNIMEICGTHTHTISKYGIREAMPPSVKLISGPGCPVCVTSAGDIQRIINFSHNNNVIITTFGDMLRVPGKNSTLAEEKACGGDIRVIYSPLNTLDIAEKNPDKEVIFYAVGFETTAPTVAAAILTARDRNLKNFSVLSLHKLTPPAMRALISSGEIEINGFLAPGHVTTIIGAGAYGFLSNEFGSPCVVAGFEPLDAIHGLYMLVRGEHKGPGDNGLGLRTRGLTLEGYRRDPRKRPRHKG
jgi:hydrogenase expression/formation protein HypD